MEKCESCGHNQANVFFKAVVNNKTTKMNLCEDCAREKGILAQEWNFPGLSKGGFSLSDAIGSLSGANQENLTQSFKTAARPASGRCPKCSTAFATFKATGFAGCSDCYETFYPAMRQIIKRIHGASLHTGVRASSGAPAPAGAKAPAKVDIAREIAKLKETLRDAVRKEAYEQAAALRDKIQELERGK